MAVLTYRSEIMALSALSAEMSAMGNPPPASSQCPAKANPLRPGSVEESGGRRIIFFIGDQPCELPR